ncbi:hypothetical protein BDR03DRAFT_1017549 [Suillus americanus]|nr:hypothetical protein BDR03DRAFT_1017549 [Suillus americanus]
MSENMVAWAAGLVRQLDKEKKLRIKLEEERRALASFISKFDSLGLGCSALPSKLLALNINSGSGPREEGGESGPIFAWKACF